MLFHLNLQDQLAFFISAFTVVGMDILRRQYAAKIAVVLIALALVLLLQPRETVIHPAPAPWLDGMGGVRIKATGVIVFISHFTTDGKVICFALNRRHRHTKRRPTTYTISQLEPWSTRFKPQQKVNENEQRKPPCPP